ncbi:hypothetical protein HDU76_001075 [Blyttiomyces sp. JEL0837]|nr:hypothetical protein HDU76_001075 [Blyttiomyces sp. JEL0837]
MSSIIATTVTVNPITTTMVLNTINNNSSNTNMTSPAPPPRTTASIAKQQEPSSQQQHHEPPQSTPTPTTASSLAFQTVPVVAPVPRSRPKLFNGQPAAAIIERLETLVAKSSCASASASTSASTSTSPYSPVMSPISTSYTNVSLNWEREWGDCYSSSGVNKEVLDTANLKSINQYTMKTTAGSTSINGGGGVGTGFDENVVCRPRAQTPADSRPRNVMSF